MNLPSKTMYDTYKDEIWKELGPLDPDWFEALTALSNEGNISDPDDLCANQEGHFKTPFDKTAADSQMFSTPKVFRHSRVVSPETEHEPSFTAEEEKETLPWTATQSPCLFRISKDGVPGEKYGSFQPQSEDSFDLHHTPQKSPVSYGKHISESLGAQIHADMSWTSSLNTPPAVPSTLILSKADESPCPVSVSEEKNVVFVRKLFPSLSNTSRVEVVSPEHEDMPAVHQAGVVSPEAEESPDTTQSSPNLSVWKQKLPDAIEDGDVRSTVASVLDGAENVLSIFFTNSSSALRKVKTDRTKRKQITPMSCSSEDVSSTHSEQRTADQEPERQTVKTGDIGITQWSPLSLSDIPASCHDSIPSTEQLQSDAASGQLIRTPLKLTGSGFTKKKRSFVYSVRTLKPQLQEKETQSQRTDSATGIPDSGQDVTVQAPDEADCCIIEKKNVQKQAEENLRPSLQAKVQGLDMSQLCKDFAQDFSQMSEPGKLSKTTQDTPRNGFSPSACLSALKQAKLKADRRHVSVTNQSNFEGTISDSGFQSAVADTTASSFVLPSSDINGESQQWTGFKINPFTSRNKGNGDARLDDISQEAEMDVKMSSAIKEGPAQQPSSAKQAVDNISCIPLNGQAHGSEPEKTAAPLPSVHASGFKTASNTSIRVSSANLKRAKRLFEDTEGEMASSDRPTISGSVKNPKIDSDQPPPSSSAKLVDVSCQLTASQKADVSELCTLLEEADSQFEFTQFKTAKIKQQDNAASPQKVDKELDPDFLSGIDFDDSFSSEAEKHLAVTGTQDKINCGTSDVTSKSTGFSTSSAKKNTNSSPKHVAEGGSSKNLDRSKLENKNPLMPGVGFKTAGGNVLRVSKKCLSKARALFTDLEENPVTSQTAADKRSSETEAEPERKSIASKFTDRDEDATKGVTNSKISGFQMAGGKGISVSVKAMQEAEGFFKDCDDMDGNAGVSVKHEKSKEPKGAKENFQTCKNVEEMKVESSKEPRNEFENVNTGPAAEVVQHNVESHSFGFKSTTAAKALSSQSSANSGGFCSASGKKLSVSADAMKKAERLLSEVPTPEDANKPRKHVSKTRHLTNQVQLSMPKNGFQTASGKGLVVSSAALKKAKLLLSECEEIEDEISVKPTHSKVSVPGPAPRNSGFLAASGKPVAFSAEALQKAKALFSDISFSAEIPAASETRKQDKKQDDGNNKFCAASGSKVSEDTNKQVRQKKDSFPPQNDGFQTASGRGVTVSPAALKKAKTLLSECEEPTNSKVSVPGPAPRNSGFLAARGKPVAFSSEALQKAKALFSDISFSAEIPAENTEKMHSGFTTAGGAKGHVSQKNLLQAKNLLEEFDDGSMQETDVFFLDKGSKKKNPSNFNQDERMTTNISEDPGSGRTEFEKVNVGQVVNHEKMKHPDKVEILKSVSKNTPDSTKAASFCGNPSLSSSLCTTSNTFGSSASNKSSIGGGFSTASGKKVSVSDEAMAKAKSLLMESESEGVEEEISVKATHSKVSVPGPAPRKSGFHAASGKPVAFSAEALQKAKALFSDISFSGDVPAASETRNRDKKQDNAENTEKMLSTNTPGSTKAAPFCRNPSLSSQHSTTSKTFGSSASNKSSNGGGFSTASRKKVSVSDEAMAKAKSLLQETVEDANKQVRQKKDIFPPQNGGFQTASGKGVTVSSEALKKAKTLLSECEEPTHSKVSVPGPAPRNSGFLAASGKPVAFSSEALQKAKALFSDISFSADVPAASETRKQDKKQDDTSNKLSSGGGFCVASGSKVSEDTNKQVRQKKDTFPPQNGGFQTASGRGVTVSSAALKKAKTLLSECEGDEDEISLKATNSKVSVPGPAPRNSGFHAASGKPVAFSSEALLKAKALFSDISFSADVPAENTEKMHSGFTTAGGAKVHVSQKNLLKAKNLLEEFADGGCPDLNSTSPHETKKADLSEVKDVERSSNCNLTTAPQVVQSFTSLQETDSPGEETSNVLDDKINQKSSSENSESSALNFQSFNLSGCTKTQQEFFAQEALDCTKALLEDESLAGQSLSMTLENVPQQDNPKPSFRSVEERKGTGKRSAEDPDMTGQPPLKRRLLEEFDRSVDGPKGSTLHAEISCPNGVMNDRRVFKYSASLHPNITRPHGNGKNYVESRLQRTPTQHCSRPEHPKTPAFVPPFLKNTKTESRSNTALIDSTRTPPAFVPPFKKQRTIVQESGSKPQEEADKHHQVSATPCRSSTSVPPTKKTQSTADGTGNKSKEDIQTAALADTTKEDLISGCGSEESHVEESSSSSQDMFQSLQNVELARDMQDMRIRKKKRQTIRPLPGSLFLTKTSGVTRIPLKAAVHGKPPARYTQKQLYGRGVHQHVCEITSDTAESFRFSLRQFIKQEALTDAGGVQLADGGWLIPRNDGTAGKEEFHRALCDTPGVDPKLISEHWVYNHYRWIVWKQASMERSFPETMGSVCLTPEQVLLQLKYRYDVEVDHSRRPALRKIMEKDDTSAKTLVLCVCGVISRGPSTNRQSLSDTKSPPGAEGKVENPSAVVWLTDGWYAIKAQLDEPLTAMLHKGRVAVGGKLIVHGAQLLGAQDACSPLEAPESLMLKICANSSRPARWDVKLGFHRDPRPFLLPVSSLYSSGGPVGCVDIILLRSYPIQWMERKPDGGVVFRSVRAEEKEARRYDSHKQKAMEILFAKIQAEFEKEEKGNTKPQRRRRTISRQSVASLQDGEELYEAVGDDPAYLEAHLSEQQLETLQTYRRCLMEKKQAELQDRFRRALESAEDGEGSCPKRDVTPVWRLCCADSMEQRSSVYQLNLWRPSSDLQSLLKEGCRYRVYNLTTSDGKKHVGSSTVQLTGTKKTQFQDLQASQEWLSARFQPRVSTHFVDLQNPDFQPLCGEVDLTGCVISVVDGQGFSPAFYLTNGKQNFVKVRCFSSFAQSGLEDLVKPRVLLALSNLQLRGQSTAPTPVVFAGDLTVFSTNPKEAHLQESLSQLRLLVQSQENFFTVAEEHLSHLLRSDGPRSVSSPALQTRTPADRRQDLRTSVTCQQPVRSLGSFTPVNRKPPAAANSSTERDPSSLKRRRALEYLSRVPSPPPLAPLGSAASPCVNKTFNPPRRSATPSTLKTVQTVRRVSSPVEDEWVNDEELAMIDTQALRVGEPL